MIHLRSKAADLIDLLCQIHCCKLFPIVYIASHFRNTLFEGQAFQHDNSFTLFSHWNTKFVFSHCQTKFVFPLTNQVCIFYTWQVFVHGVVVCSQVKFLQNFPTGVGALKSQSHQDAREASVQILTQQRRLTRALIRVEAALLAWQGGLKSTALAISIHICWTFCSCISVLVFRLISWNHFSKTNESSFKFTTVETFFPKDGISPNKLQVKKYMWLCATLKTAVSRRKPLAFYQDKEMTHTLWTKCHESATKKLFELR